MKKTKEKKKYAEPEMGYCPLSIRQSGAGLGAGLGVRTQGAQVGTRGAQALG